MATKTATTKPPAPAAPAPDPAPPPPAALATIPNGHDLLADMPGVDDDADTGLGELAPSDYKTPYKSLNRTGLDPAGKKLAADAWFDSLLQTAKPVVRAVLVYLHKRNEYSVFDKTTRKAKVFCASQDCKAGTWRESGAVRPCMRCPDAQWAQGGDGKPHRNCDEVRDVFAFDVEDQRAFKISFRRTTLKTLDEHLDRHHKRKRFVRGKGYSDYHLYSFVVQLSAKMDASGLYAQPIVTVERVVTGEEFSFFAAQAAYVRDEIIPSLTHVDDASFDFGANAGDDDDRIPSAADAVPAAASST